MVIVGLLILQYSYTLNRYSSVDFQARGYTGISGQRRSYTDRERAPTPTDDDEDSLDEDGKLDV